jgi:hypothetical protein
MNHPILQQLFDEVPMIVVASASIVAAFVLWRRAPLSSLLLVLACVTSLALLILYPFAYEAAVRSLGTDGRHVASIKIAFAVGWSVARAIYLILLVVAIYAGRKHP